MILSFAKTTPWGTNTNFKDQLQEGVKIHTFRQGWRWKPGMPIHFWQGNPRNPSKDTFAFDIKREVYESTTQDDKGRTMPACYAVENFTFEFIGDDGFELKIGEFYIDNPSTFELVALQDGFTDAMDLYKWFKITADKQKVKKIEGQIVHWTRNGVYDVKNARTL